MLDREAQLEAFEPDRYVSLFFVPAALRDDVAAIYAFEMELARVATQVAEPMVAQIRYAWWREQVAAVFDGRPGQAPVFRAIAPVVAKYNLPRALLDKLIDGHALDCERFPFADLDQLERYARETSGCAFKLAARVLGAEARIDTVAEMAGVAYGASRQLLEGAHWRRHKRFRLPLDLVPTAGVDEEALFSEMFDRGIVARAVGRVKDMIRSQLTLLNSALYPSRYVSILAPAAMARVATHDRFDVFSTPPVSSFQRVARLTSANLLLRF